jgi:hypothetical protein
MVSDAPAAAIAQCGVGRELPLDELAAAAIAACDTAG